MTTIISLIGYQFGIENPMVLLLNNEKKPDLPNLMQKDKERKDLGGDQLDGFYYSVHLVSVETYEALINHPQYLGYIEKKIKDIKSCCIQPIVDDYRNVELVIGESMKTMKEGKKKRKTQKRKTQKRKTQKRKSY